MKKIVLVFIVLCLAGISKAQKPESMALSGSDAIAVLEAMGVSMVKFDFSMFQDKTCNFSIYIDEYTKGEEKKRIINSNFGQNRMLVSEEYIEMALKKDSIRGEYIDKEKKLLLKHQEASVYILPDTDSTVICRVNLLNGGAVRGVPLKLKTLKGSRRGAMYNSRPFVINEYDASTPEIPLMFYGSHWFDEKANLIRFCGESRIKKDLSSEIVKNVPHFYVIGVRIEEVK